jgi:2-oxo-4-hydroxy-4-carboxy-5-ureidoimidazoline decarboxylase
MTLADINAMDRDAFVHTLGGVVEHSPWIAAEAWQARPFASIDALHAALMRELTQAPTQTQLAVMRAHPELAGKAAIRGELTRDSGHEQSGAGLTECTPAEFARLSALNKAYNERFGFPFIIAVKGLDRAAIIRHFGERLEHDRAREFDEALAQIGRIVRLRLDAMLV